MAAFLVDMDGVLYHGERVLPGAPEFVRNLTRTKHLFITNNPTLPSAEIAGKLCSLGFGEISAEQVLTSAQAAARWLKLQKPRFSYFAIGAYGLHEALSAVGREDSSNADYVVVGEGEGLDYRSLTTGINLLLARDATLVATNPDVNVDAVLDGERLVLPGGGALVAPFEVATAQ